jgi:hypothetical protein
MSCCWDHAEDGSVHRINTNSSASAFGLRNLWFSGSGVYVTGASSSVYNCFGRAISVHNSQPVIRADVVSIPGTRRVHLSKITGFPIQRYFTLVEADPFESSGRSRPWHQRKRPTLGVSAAWAVGLVARERLRGYLRFGETLDVREPVLMAAGRGFGCPDSGFGSRQTNLPVAKVVQG